MTSALTGLGTVVCTSSDLVADKVWWAQLLGPQPYFSRPLLRGVDGARPGLTTVEREQIREFKKEVVKLRRANEIHKRRRVPSGRSSTPG
jgi:hypothetical protein